MNKPKLTSERRELRYLPDTNVAVRAETSEDGKRYFIGYAAVFNVRSKLIWDWDRVFYEIIKPEAFDNVLAREKVDIPLVTNHERYKVLARTISGNLEVSVDEVGLKFRALVPDTTLGNDTYEMIDRGDFTDCSFMFRVEESGSAWYKDADDNLIHEVREVLDLMDLTICSFHGAYSETVIDTETASRHYDELIREADGSDDGKGGGTPPVVPEGGTPTPTPEEIAETEKATATDLDEAEMDLELKKAEYGIEPDKNE